MKLFILLLFIPASVCNAQEFEERNDAVSMEFGKTGFLKSFTFDHRFTPSDFGIRALLGGTYSQVRGAFQAGVGAYHLFGKSRRYFELGVDAAYLNVWVDNDDVITTVSLFYPDYPVSTIYTSMNLGYRAYGNKWIFRAGVSPGVLDGDFVPGGYVSFGLTF